MRRDLQRADRGIRRIPFREEPNLAIRVPGRPT